jgi:hypothetical protein
MPESPQIPVGAGLLPQGLSAFQNRMQIDTAYRNQDKTGSTRLDRTLSTVPCLPVLISIRAQTTKTPKIISSF